MPSEAAPVIGPGYVTMMAAYNQWQNRSLYGCAAQLSDEERRRDRGAFFGSIQQTLAHIMKGDRVWLERFGVPAEELGPVPADDFAALAEARVRLDALIVRWAASVDATWLAGSCRWYSGMTKMNMERPHTQLVAHLFNHQTHHRGQAHALLTAAGCKPDDTDLHLLALEEARAAH